MIPLVPNGEQILVTNDNADLYLNALARYHLSQKVSREIAAFRAGFTYVVPEDFLLNFDENELEVSYRLLQLIHNICELLNFHFYTP